MLAPVTRPCQVPGSVVGALPDTCTVVCAGVPYAVRARASADQPWPHCKGARAQGQESLTEALCSTGCRGTPAAATVTVNLFFQKHVTCLQMQWHTLKSLSMPPMILHSDM